MAKHTGQMETGDPDRAALLGMSVSNEVLRAAIVKPTHPSPTRLRCHLCMWPRSDRPDGKIPRDTLHKPSLYQWRLHIRQATNLKGLAYDLRLAASAPPF